MERVIRELLSEMGENPEREGLLETPKRVKEMYQTLTKGYKEDPRAILNGAVFEQKCDEMIVVKDIEFYSLCEHHLLPFFGKAHVGYLPDGRVLGLGKIPRFVEMYSRRLQLQERMTTEIASSLWEAITPKGVAVVVEGSHLCMQMRGEQNAGSKVITSAMLGKFRSDPRTREEFLSFIHRTHA